MADVLIQLIELAYLVMRDLLTDRCIEIDPEELLKTVMASQHCFQRLALPAALVNRRRPPV